jgi:exoribonuclease-2
MPSTDQRTALRAIARKAMIDEGLQPEPPTSAMRELSRMGDAPREGLRDLRHLPWSSIDNDESRDLDQLEVCIEGRTTRLLIAIADVDGLVDKGSALDAHAGTNTTSVYTPAQIFPMLPEELSTDRTSLNPGEDRPACVVDIAVAEDGTIGGFELYRAVVCNNAKLTYEGVSAWLEGGGPEPAGLARVTGLDRQIRLQDRLATALGARREREGALTFARTEVKPVLEGDEVSELRTELPNRAREMIEHFMVTANAVTAEFLSAHGVASIRRVVRSPDRWDRIVELAARVGGRLPPAPDAQALETFLEARRAAAPGEFAELSLSVIKLLGRGEYAAGGASGTSGHFALAVSNYTHSTAPNRRYPDLLTQRMVKAVLARQQPPYSIDELTVLAEHCTRQEDAANKVERLVKKAASALWLSNRLGQEFDAVVTGTSGKATWIRLATPPVEGKLERGFEGLDVGDRIRVRLIATDVERGFVDFARV